MTLSSNYTCHPLCGEQGLEDPLFRGGYKAQRCQCLSLDSQPALGKPGLGTQCSFQIPDGGWAWPQRAQQWTQLRACLSVGSREQGLKSLRGQRGRPRRGVCWCGHPRNKLLEQPLLPLCSMKQLQPHLFTSHSNSRMSILDKANCPEEEESGSLAESLVLARAQVWRRGSGVRNAHCGGARCTNGRLGGNGQGHCGRRTSVS